MNTRILVLFSLSTLLLACREKAPLVNLGNAVQPADTTYLASPENPMPRNVLIEEFTGVSCPPCPQGHEVVTSIKGQYPGRVVVIANHIYNFPQAEPVEHLSNNDLRTQFATDIGNYFGGVSGMPLAVIDRMPDNSNTYFIGKGTWSNTVANRMNLSAPVNLYLSSTYDENLKTAKLKLKIAYTRSINAKHKLTLVITESNIIDAQKTNAGIDTFYTHNYVLRNIITQTTGNAILDSIPEKIAGRVIERLYDIDINPAWNVNNCKAVAIIHYDGAVSKEVLQVAEISIK